MVQIRKIQDTENSQRLQKFIWAYFCILLIEGIHHVVMGMSAEDYRFWITDYVDGLSPIMDFMHLATGIILSLYLYDRRIYRNKPNTNETK